LEEIRQYQVEQASQESKSNEGQLYYHEMIGEISCRDYCAS